MKCTVCFFLSGLTSEDASFFGRAEKSFFRSFVKGLFERTFAFGGNCLPRRWRRRYSVSENSAALIRREEKGSYLYT